MLTNFRKRTALLLSVAVVCASVALVPQAANAASSKNPNAGTVTDPYIIPASTTVLKACPGTSAPAAGFTDTTSTDVDCIKMFGVTTGKTATTYDPTGTISRQDMARFIHRMFVPTSMAAAGATAVPAFTDIAHVDAGGTAAINALASHGITVGTTATTFSPDSNVTRQDMALFLYRFAQIVKAFNEPTTAGITMSIADQAFNYSDIANISFEAMEAIIGLYNAGVTGETCATVATAATCGSTYRPTEDMTRAEMASMLTALLNHTNARPAGVTVQPKTAISAAAIDSWVSCRNADFTPNSNTLVDVFQDLVDDTSATTQAASIPFNAILNTVSTSGTGVSGPSVPGTMETGDKLCSVLGNVDGESITMAAAKTGKWWAWTGAQGTIYVDGTTTAFLYTASLAAGATATYATTATHAWDNTAATVNNFGGTFANVTSTAGSNTYQGTSRVLTTTLTGATAAVVDGYTLKYVDKVVNYGGGTGQETVSYVTTYVASSAGKASLTVTCSADPKPLTNNAINNGAPDVLDYYESHEITITFATAAGVQGWPALGVDPTDAGITAPALSCDDVARAYPGGDSEDASETITVNQNYADVATAGTLVSATVTAYDQYGIGIAGITARIDTTTKTNVALTAIASVGPTNRATLTTGADGTATLTVVACTANGSVAFLVNAAGTMDAHAIDVPAAGAVEGTTVYCTTPGTDTVSTQTLNANRADVQEVQTVLFFLANGTAADPANGSYIITYNGEAGDAIAHGASAADHHNAINSNANMASVVATMVSGNVGFVLTFPANTGDHPAVTVAGTDLRITNGSGALVPDANMTITETTKGVSGVTFDFVDDNPGANSITTVKTVKDRTANIAGSATNVAVVTTWYQSWTYDSTDSFATGLGLANQSRTEAEFEATNALISNLTTNAALVYRTGATTTGVSHFTVG